MTRRIALSPCVSFIVPCFNREDVISETLDSIQAQTFEDFEVLIVDDCSSDGSQGIIQEYCDKDPRFHLLRMDENSGAPICRNIGLGYAKGRYVNFVDSDDILHSAKLSEQVPAIESHNADFVLCQIQRFATIRPGGNMPDYGNISKEISLHSYLEDLCAWSTISPLWSRKFLTRIGGFATELECFQDWELNARALFHEPKVVSLPQVLGYYRNDWSENQVSGRRSKRTAKAMFNSRRLVGERLTKDKQLLGLCSAAMRKQWLGTLHNCFRHQLYFLAAASFIHGFSLCISFKQRSRFVKTVLITLYFISRRN